jgi:hypothetical protein
MGYQTYNQLTSVSPREIHTLSFKQVLQHLPRSVSRAVCTAMLSILLCSALASLAVSAFAENDGLPTYFYPPDTSEGIKSYIPSAPLPDGLGLRQLRTDSSLGATVNWQWTSDQSDAEWSVSLLFVLVGFED